MTGKVFDSDASSALVLILPIALVVVILFTFWPWILLIIGLGIAWRLWQEYQWQQWCKQVDPPFYQLIDRHRGCVTPLDLSIQANLTGRAAILFLEKKAVEFGAQRQHKDGGTIYYFLTTRALGNIFDDSEPLLEVLDREEPQQQTSPHSVSTAAQATPPTTVAFSSPSQAETATPVSDATAKPSVVTALPFNETPTTDAATTTAPVEAGEAVESEAIAPETERWEEETLEPETELTEEATIEAPEAIAPATELTEEEAIALETELIEDAETAEAPESVEPEAELIEEEPVEPEAELAEEETVETEVELTEEEAIALETELSEDAETTESEATLPEEEESVEPEVELAEAKTVEPEVELAEQETVEPEESAPDPQLTEAAETVEPEESAPETQAIQGEEKAGGVEPTVTAPKPPEKTEPERALVTRPRQTISLSALQEIFDAEPESEEEYAEEELAENPVPGLIQAELAKRLDLHSSTVGKRKSDLDFAEWSQSKDPDGIAWEYSPDTKTFLPLNASLDDIM